MRRPARLPIAGSPMGRGDPDGVRGTAVKRHHGVASLVLAVLFACAGTALAQSLIEDVDGLFAAAAAGGSYLLAPGDFVLPETLVIAHDLELRGESMNATAIDAMGTAVGIEVEDGTTVRLEALSIGYEAEGAGDVVRVHDARLDLVDVRIGFARTGPSNDAGRPFGVGAGLLLTGSAHATVTRGGLGRNAWAGAEMHDAAVLELIDTEIVANGTGVHADGETRLDVRGTEFRDHTGNALFLIGATEAVIHASRFADNGSVVADVVGSFDGVRIGGSADVVLDGVTFVDHPRFALSLFDAARVRSSGSVFESNGGYDATTEFFQSAVLVENEAQLSMTGDVLRANPGGALEISGGATVELVDVTVTETGTWAHAYVIDAARLVVRNSRFVDNEGALYAAGGARVEVSASEFLGGDAEGIIVDERAVLELRDSVVRSNVEFGVVLSSDARATITRTTIEDNRTGVVMYGSSRANVSDSDVHGNDRSGIAFIETSTGDATNNRVDGNGWHGIVVADDARANVTGNVLVGNGERGILYDGRAAGRVDGNTVHSSPKAFAVWAEAAPQVGANTLADADSEIEGSQPD